PTIELVRIEDTRELDRALAQLDRYAAIVFGSKNAADAVLDRAAELGVTLELPLACVGSKTLAHVAKRTGSTRAFAPAEHRAEALVEKLVEEIGPSLAGLRILFPRALEGRELLIEELTARGASVDAICVYRIASAPPAGQVERARLAQAEIYTFLSGET